MWLGHLWVSLQRCQYLWQKREVHEFLKQANLEIVGTSSKAQISIYEKEFQSKVAMVMGSESTGLGEFWEKIL